MNSGLDQSRVNADHEAGSPAAMSRVPTPLTNLIALLSVLALLFATLGGVLTLRSVGRHSTTVVFIFVPLFALLGTLLFDEIRRRPYSLNLIHLIAVYLLMGASALYQVAMGSYPLTHFNTVQPGRAEMVNAVVILWLFFYAAGYYWRRVLPRQATEGIVARFLSRNVSLGQTNIALLLCVPVFGYLLWLGLGGVVTRAGATETLASSDTGPIYLINKVFARALPFIAALAAFLQIRRLGVFRAGTTTVLAIVVALGIWYADNPLAGARYWTVSVLLGLAAPVVFDRFRSAAPLLACLVVGLAVMPALGEARHSENAKELVDTLTSISVPSPVVYLATSGDVGAYGVIDLTLRWTESHGHTLGQQALAWILFFVPRAIWPSKPISTGALVTGDLGFDFTIISAPIMTEPLIDFGWLGIPPFAFVFGRILHFLDDRYHTGRTKRRVRRIDVMYPFLLGLVLLMTRGSMMSAVAFSVGFMLSGFPLVLRLPLATYAPGHSIRT